MRVVLRLVPIYLLMTACTVSQTKPGTVSHENNELLIDQNSLLADHAARLDSLSESQDIVLEQLNALQSQMKSIARKMADVAKPAPNSPEDEPNTIAESGQNLVNEDDKTFGGKAILGRVEYVWLDSVNEYLKARIDTGAKSSSLNASKVQRFERNGDPWVRFEIMIEGKAKSLEAPLQRYAKIRQASVDESERRPVVKLTIRLGELVEEAEFTLSNRKEMLYPVLLGRSFLQDIAVVDVAKKFTRRRDPKLTAQVNR